MALVIENDFKKVSSTIGHLQDPNTQFVFGDELMQKNKVDSIIPGATEFQAPQYVEVWSFSLKQWGALNFQIFHQIPWHVVKYQDLMNDVAFRIWFWSEKLENFIHFSLI